jgi:membrane-bound metal-dependent hydrolase YbcI (DUF457 family)
MPDVIDAFPAVWRGHFGQGLGHSLARLVVLGVPVGIVLWAILQVAARRIGYLSHTHFPARAWNLGLAAFHKGTRPATFFREWRRVIAGLALGGFSHLCFDLISHGGLPWLMPWVPKIRIFPQWWHATWASIPIPGHEEPYAVGPYLTVWISLSALGIYLLIRPALKPVSEDKAKEE